MKYASSRPNTFSALVLTLLALVLAACTTQPERAEALASVGQVSITGEDIAYRQQVQSVRSGEPFPAHLALLQLLQEALMVEVARAHGVVVSEAMLADEAERVQETSRDLETLAQIQTVFDQDEGAYRRLVLQPTLVNQLLHARFSLGHDIQAEPLARAEQLLAAAKEQPASLESLAQDYGGEYRLLQVHDGLLVPQEGALSGDQPGEDQVAGLLAEYDLEWPDYDRQFVEQVLEGLEDGQLHPKVVEDRHNFMVVRLLSRDGQQAQLERVVIPKLTFDPWFQTQSQRIPLVINDQQLKADLLAAVDLPYLTGRLSSDQ